MKAVLCAVALFLCAPAWAINKCTGADGKVSYQEASCSGAAKVEEIKTSSPETARDGRWQFSRDKDKMTGAITCFVYSPSVMVLGSKGAPFVSAQLAMRGDLRVLSFRTSSSATDLFHNDIRGMGVKVDENSFVPIDRKISATAVGISPSDELQVIQQLQTGKQVRIRARFWPWDPLGDSLPLTLSGFKQAFSLAQECAKST